MTDFKDVLKTAGLAAGGFVLLSLAGALPFLVEQDAPEQVAGWAESAHPGASSVPYEPLTTDDHALTLVPTLASLDPTMQRTGLDALSMLLDRSGAEELSEGVRDEVGQALVALAADTSVEAEGTQELREDAVRLMIAKVHGDIVRDYVLEVLDTDDAGLRLTALESLVEPGALRDKEISEKAYELTKDSSVPDWVKPAVLRKTRGKKSEAELLALLKRSSSYRTVSRTAVELQNLHKPELMAPVLERLERTGMLQDPKKLPWFSGKLLAEHIRKAEGQDLLRALRVVRLKPSLARPVLPAVKERLAKAQPIVRLMAARIIPDAVQHEDLDPDSGEETLAALLATETDPAVKTEIEGGLDRVRQARRSHPEAQEPPVD